MTSTMRFDKWENTLGQTYGTVLQVVSKTSPISYAIGTTAHTWTSFPSNGLQLSITPKFSTSKLFLMANITIGGTSSNNAAFRFIRDGNLVGVGDAFGSRARLTAFSGWSNGVDNNHVSRTISSSFLDNANAISPIVYDIQGTSESSTLLWNRQSNYTDSSLMYNATAVSSFTIMEIAQ
jgi:hypothetical protein